MELSTLLLRVLPPAVNLNDDPNAMRQKHQEVHALEQEPLAQSPRRRVQMRHEISPRNAAVLMG